MCYESIEVIYISFDIGEVADYRKEPNRRGMPVVVEARGSGDEWENTSQHHE
tara:strand:+ start:385 stop:540 length:156 start_codon:yes stop_codon:yes gene_type:complete